MPSRAWSRGSLSEILGAPLPAPEKLRKYSWLFDIVRIKGSVTLHILGPVLTCTLFATAVAVAHIIYDYHIHLTNQVVPLLSVVVGLILVFRNGTSYDRWYEGSKDWEATISLTRNITRQVWISVNVNDPKTTTPSSSEAFLAEHQALRQDKIRTLNLLTAFLFAVKHHLRGEYGTNHADYAGLLPREFTRFNHETANQHEHAGEWQTPGNSGNATPAPLHPTRITDVGTTHVQEYTDERTPLVKDQHHIVHFHPYSTPNALSMPLIIAHEITRSLHGYRKKGYLDLVGPAGANALNTLVQNLVSQFAKVQRVLNTPIPASYGIHLKQCVTLYLFTLPFTLVSDLGWFMIPVVTVVSFTLMGIEGIADEIEMPFGYDYYDLPLDRMCNEVRSEIMFTIQRLPEGVEPYEVE
ncbi:UPF0187-domain-containing protein [Clavulina sp. PMI_390]|nr:UPF0187-domain-containing protein [Clavulina sp. PMI_390]